ncbi:MAG TPA: hypothetical protein VGS06_29465 [Streptosporangiaceae bacterium]|nr:hypothetical protein [Streptosporangiaceae bacterium]
MRQHLPRAACLGLALGLALTACASNSRAPQGPSRPGHWVLFRHVPGVVDLAGPGGDGSFTVAAAGRLFILSRAGVLRPFARGPGGYATALGPEPYITMAGNDRVAGTRCSFRSGMVFALQPGGRPGIILIGADGQARRFASLPGTVTPNGIAFDATGHFGHMLLVTAGNHEGTSVLAIDCAGEVRVITNHAPAMEGGIAVAPASFGRYGGDLVAPGETSGRVFAIRPDGSVVTLVVSGLPHGADIGVESAGFVPPGFSADDAAYLADRFSIGNRHPGTDSILRLPGRELISAGVRAGDLLIATEASARTIVVRCASSCTARYIAVGPAVSHAEGHIAFTSVGR